MPGPETNAEGAKPLIIGRVFGGERPEDYPQRLGSFVRYSTPFGIPTFVVPRSYDGRDDLKKFVLGQRILGYSVNLVKSYARVEPNHIDYGGLINSGIELGRKKRAECFALVANDLAEYIPQALPVMLERMRSDPLLATVGVAIDTVHDLDLLERVKVEGMHAISPSNYATVFPNNAFSLHRIRPHINGHQLSSEETFFTQLFEDQLGIASLGGREIPLGGNEEIERILRLLKMGHPLKTLLLAGDFTIKRDPENEISSVLFKKDRRQLVAARYQGHPDYDISDSALSHYLNNYYKIEFYRDK